MAVKGSSTQWMEATVTGPVDFGQLKTGEWQDLHEVADRLEAAWRRSDAVDLTQFLPPSGLPMRLPILHELIKTELECRYRRSQPVLLEDYLRRFPELGTAQTLAPELIYEEYLVRHRHGDRPSLESYRTRFPAQFAELERLVREQPVRTVAGELPGTLPGAPFPRTGSPGAPAPGDPTLPRSSASGVTGSRVLGVHEGYETRALLGRGQFGEVFRALSPGGVPVALKRSFRPLDDEASQRELKGLQLLRELNHPYLLQMHQFLVIDGRLHIVMELADGSLQEWFERCRKAGQPGIPVDELLSFFREAAEALDYLHSQHVLHRDIKPQNLLMLKGHAKVADFGLAREQEASMIAGTICGTPLFMAPEVWEGKVGERSDQYSLAITYVEMRTGVRAFSAHDPFAMGLQHRSGAPNLEGVGKAEQKVLRRALAKKPEERYASCGAFVAALIAAVQADRPAPELPRRGLTWPLRIGLGSALLALIGVPVLLLVVRGTNPKPTDPPSLAWLQGFEPDEGAQVEGKYYNRIVRPLEGLEPSAALYFRLVPQKNPADPPPFYVLRDKVTNEQLRAALQDPAMEKLLAKYQQKHKWTVKRVWQEALADPKKAKLPLLGVTVTEAHCFAEWVGGRLPSAWQWDKAGGRYDGQPGPFKPDWKPQEQLRSADDLQGDESVFGCRGMAANGKEWTRDPVIAGGREVPWPNPNLTDGVLVRGHPFTSTAPFGFKQLVQAGPECGNYEDADPAVGFRIVLEPPDERP
jgi:serine/threonine protein kinase